MLSKEQLDINWANITQVRQVARTNLLYLCREILGYKDVSKEVHGEIISTLQKFKGGSDTLTPQMTIQYRPACDLWDLQGPRNTIILFPRGHLKTSIITQAHAIQWIINYPDIRILISTATGEQCQRMMREIKGHFQFNNNFRRFFPEFCPAPKKAADWGNQEEFTVPCRTVVKREATVSMCSVGKVIAGSHYEVIKNSDLVDKENVKTPNQINDVISHFGYLNPLLERSAKPPYHGWTDVEGTRYDFGDLYGRLIDGGTYHTLVRPRAGQDTCWAERFPVSELKRIEKEVGSYIYCTPVQTPILMADGTFKKIEDVQIGDEVLGWDDNKARAPLQISKVLDRGETQGICQAICTESGAVAIATKDHLWFNGRSEDGRPHYSKVSDGYHTLKSLQRVCHVPVASVKDHYLAGIFDGEGSLTAKTTLNITQSNGKNAVVCEKIREQLKYWQFSWKEHYRKEQGKQDSILFQLHGGIDTVFKFMEMFRPARRAEIVKRLLPNTKRFCHSDKILKVYEQSAPQRVFWLQTETGNYVAWGFASKNSCQYRNRPVPPEGGLCDPKDIVFMPRKVINDILPMLRLHTTIDLHGLEPARNDNDFTVLNVHGFDRDGRLYVVDLRRGRFTPDEVIWQVFDIHKRYPQMIDYRIEKDAHARVLLPFLQREASKRQRFPVILPIKRDTHVSKQQRIRGLQPWFKSGIIRFSDDLACKTDIILEIMQFPSQSSGVHDDILDTLADAMQGREPDTVTDDVVSNPFFDPQELFGHERPRDKFLGFGPDGQEQWLYGGSEQKAVVSPTGVL